MVDKKTQIKRILGEYTENSTIAGLHYAFDSSQGPMLYNFFVRNLLIFVISLSVCPWQGFSALANKHASLVQKFVKSRP